MAKISISKISISIKLSRDLKKPLWKCLWLHKGWQMNFMNLEQWRNQTPSNIRNVYISSPILQEIKHHIADKTTLCLFFCLSRKKCANPWSNKHDILSTFGTLNSVFQSCFETGNTRSLQLTHCYADRLKIHLLWCM